MKQPTIMYNGVKVKVYSIDWSGDGSISHVSFMDENGKYCTAHKKHSWDEDGYNEHGILHLDLEKAMAHNEGSGQDE